MPQHACVIMTYRLSQVGQTSLKVRQTSLKSVEASLEFVQLAAMVALHLQHLAEHCDHLPNVRAIAAHVRILGAAHEKHQHAKSGAFG